MAKTTINIDIKKPDDTAEEGYIYFALAESAALDDVEYSRTPIRVNLDASGLASIQLRPNDDAGWSVSGNSYLVEERFSGKAPRRFYMVVPTSGSALDYADLATYGNAPSITANIDLAAEFAAFEAAANATYAPEGVQRGLVPAPLRAPVVTAQGADPNLIGVFSGYTWGSLGTTIYRSSDGGVSWNTYATGCPAGTIIDFLPTGDGEVVLITATKIYRSSAWASSPTWSEKATANGACQFQPWSLSGVGTKFITTEYAAGANFADSRYVRVSLDAGATWNVVYDSVNVHGSTLANASHLHGCCYDPWGDRFYVSEGHGTIAGLYCSTDDGATWDYIPGTYVDPAPTVIVATNEGLVAGTDGRNAGLYGLIRKTDPTVEVFGMTLAHRPGREGSSVFGVSGFRDPATGHVYIGYRTEATTTAPLIAGGTPHTGGLLYVWPTLPVVISDDIRRVVITPEGDLLAHANISATYRFIRSQAPVAATPSASIADTGGVLGGVAYGGQCVAVGVKATTAAGLRATVVGEEASFTGAQDGVVIGQGALGDVTNATVIGQAASANSTASGGTVVGRGSTGTGANSTALGYLSSASSSAVAIGSSAVAPTSSVVIGASASVPAGSQAVAVGQLAAARNSGVTVGHNSTASGNDSVIVGQGCTASDSGVIIGKTASGGSSGVAVGKSSAATASESTALGTSSSATHARSVALGKSSTTTAADQVAMGGRNIEIVEMTAPTAPATNGARIYAVDNGGGKTQLAVRFATGAVQILATEP